MDTKPYLPAWIYVIHVRVKVTVGRESEQKKKDYIYIPPYYKSNNITYNMVALDKSIRTKKMIQMEYICRYACGPSR